MPLAQQRRHDSSSRHVARLGGRRFFVLDTSKGPRGMGGRAWEESLQSESGVPAEKFSIDIASFHQGAGFTFAGMEHTYDLAGRGVTDSILQAAGDGWDATTIGKLSTWSRHAYGDELVTTDFRGWLVAHGGALYLCRGRYVAKYTPNTTADAEWAIDGTNKDLGSGNHAGKPISWNGALYVPVIDDSTGALEQFVEIVTGSPDTYDVGPTERRARAFGRLRELLVRADGNGIATCAADPLDEGNWSDAGGNDTYVVCPPEVEVTDIIEWGSYTLCATENGLYSLDVNFDPKNELPQLSIVVDPQNGEGACASNGGIFYPHAAGLIDWNPEEMKWVGPGQEGALEATLTPGFTRPGQVIPYGDRWYVVWNDEVAGVSTIGSLLPAKGNSSRGPYLPHSHFQIATHSFESLAVVRVDASHIYLATIFVFSNGTDCLPWVWQLPLGDNSPAQDASISKLASNTVLKTSRFWGPQRTVSKLWREVEFWVDLAAATDVDEWDTVGFEVWASIEDDDPVQLMDSQGLPLTVKATGRHVGWLPPTVAAVGHYAQLELRVPALMEGQSPVGVTVREIHWRGGYLPERSTVIKTTLVLAQGEFEDGSSAGTTEEQKRFLQSLAEPPQEESEKRVVDFANPQGREGYCTIQTIGFQEAQSIGPEGESGTIAQLTLQVERFTNAAPR